MKMSFFKRAIRGVMKPELIKEFIDSKINILPYRLGRSRAFYPKIIYVVINSTCNLKCKMCDIGQMNEESEFYKNLKKGAGEIPIKKYKRFIDDVSGFRPKIVLSSTEPLLYKDLLEAIRYTKRKGLSMTVTTNGLLLERFAKDLVDAGLDELIVSVDGPPKVHDNIRGVPRCFERLYKGIEALNKHKEENGTSKPIVRINTTVTEFNYDKIIPMLKALEPLNVFDVAITHMNFITKNMCQVHNRVCTKYPVAPSNVSATDVSKIDIKRLYKEIARIKDTDPSYFVTFVPDMNLTELKRYYLEPLKKIPGHDICTIPWRVSQITSNGDVVPLTRCFNIPMGNIYKQRFRNIWNNKKYMQFRQDLLDKKTFPACNRCCGVF